MRHANLTLHPDFTVGEVHPRLFGSFVEHLGRCVYTGLFEPEHPTAGADGLRGDVLALIRELGTTMVRYPGGNFVSGYRWEDGVGPVDRRPRRLDPAWRAVESNRFGLGEFMAFAGTAGVEPMLAVNLGTRGIADACDLLEYANFLGGTALSDARGGAPYDIRLWCLGNELDGPWQTGHKTADEYGKLAVATARAMRAIEPDLRLTACGSSGMSMPTFGAWEATVLEQCYDEVDYISCHAYYQENDGDLASFAASAENMERFIEAVAATADHVRARRRSARRMEISFDEWNVWYMRRRWQDSPEWTEARRQLEDVYTVTDAVVVGSLLIALLRHCDRVTAACLAQLVNVIAPIMTEPGGPAWRQTTFHPFALTARYGRGQVLLVPVDGPTHETAAHGDVPVLHATAVQAEDGTTTLFAVNRDPAEPLHLAADVRALGPVEVLSHEAIWDADRHATNTAARPDRVVPRDCAGATIDDENGRLSAELPPLSWNILRLGPRR